MKTKKFQSTKKKQGELRSRMKPAKRGLLVKGSWKAVQLDPSLFSEEDMGGLVCFEELTDYRLVDSAKTAAKVGSEEEDKRRRKKKKAQKRKGDLGGPAGEGVSEHDEQAKPLKKKKVLTDQGQSDAPVVGEETDGEASATQEAVAPEDKEPLPPAKPKKKKNKKKVKKEKKESAETRPPQPTARAETRPPQPTARAEPAAKASSVPKKKAKNWTGAAISDCVGKEADVSAWKDLFVPEPVLKALSCLGFSSPTPIQALALPPAIRDRMDILGAAETGSGKTLSFGIPMIHSILEWRKAQEGISPSQADGEVQVESLYLPMVGQPAQDKDDDDDEEESEKDDESDVEQEVDNEEGSLGCVKVIEDVEFDFDTTSEIGQKKTQAYQNQPLLGLVLTPTRELAVQVKHHIDAVAQFTGIKTAILVGGMALQKQNRMLKRRPEMVIATPGRLWELIKEGHPHLQNLRQLRCLVIDEADRMVEKGHFAELENLLELLNNAQFSPERQTFVFSATLTMVHQTPTRVLQKKKGRKVDQDGKLKLLMEKVGIKAKPKVIDLTRKEATVETLTETRIHCVKDDKDFYLYYFLLQYPGRSMVFANSIDCVKRLSSLLTILERSPLPLHANMHQKQRLKNLERFAEKDSCVLLTTDVAARGLDIPDVQHVIHYQVPRTSETYVHRSGRTARATKQGLSLLLIGPDDVINFRRIYRTLGKDEELPTFPIQTKCMAAIKERVTVARKIEKIEYHNSREKQHNSWFKQAAEALEVELDDDVLLGGKKGEDEDKQQQKMVKGLKKHLKHLLSQPVFKNDMKTKYPTQMGKLALPELPLASVQTALDSVNIQAQTQKRKNRLY